MTTKRRKNPVVRNPDETVATFNLPKKLKSDLESRANDIQRPVAFLIRSAIEVQEKRGWKDVPLALRVGER